ncbi:hypothetical protein BHYA_0123g00250 [Botrytis hyacinthi]|uniref:Uncharacterized protein n=1 Tax=Botrytis hyacinthi TaxID=278943 RepID=A0A4Z1GSI1_9HELO|nr:hypothetical protein BHYA_0123g00250 [Botrytis hyacinthi]
MELKGWKYFKGHPERGDMIQDPKSIIHNPPHKFRRSNESGDYSPQPQSQPHSDQKTHHAT